MCNSLLRNGQDPKDYRACAYTFRAYSHSWQKAEEAEGAKWSNNATCHLAALPRHILILFFGTNFDSFSFRSFSEG